VDTDVNVDSSALLGLAKKIGASLWENRMAILKFVLTNAAVMGAMTGAQQLLAFWYQKANQSYAGEQPSAAAPLALLLNYMTNPANTVEQRWTTFSYYVAGGATAAEQNLVVSGILSMKTPAEDAALAAWRWSTADQTAAVNAMERYTAPAQQPQAYTALAAYTYDSKTLPIKVGAGVALQYIAKIL
jgi:hypothetical protein